MKTVVVETSMEDFRHTKGGACEFLPSAADSSGFNSKFAPWQVSEVEKSVKKSQWDTLEEQLGLLRNFS